MNSPSLLAEETGIVCEIDLIRVMIGSSSSVGSRRSPSAFLVSRIITLFVHFSGVAAAGEYQVRAISNPRVLSFAEGMLIRGFVVEGIRCIAQYCRVSFTLYHPLARMVMG